MIKVKGKKKIPEGAVVIIVSDKEEILILKRPSTVNWAPNKWALPGGKLESGESPLTAAVRETKEETSLDIKNLKIVDIKVDNFIVAYYTREYNGTVELDFEHTDWAWASREEIETYDLAPQVLEMYDWVLTYDY